MPLTQEDIDAITNVQAYATQRLKGVELLNVFTEEDECRLLKDAFGGILYKVDNVHIVEKEVDNGYVTWYVAATVFFLTSDKEDIEGSTDTYMAYKSDGWYVSWFGC